MKISQKLTFGLVFLACLLVGISIWLGYLVKQIQDIVSEAKELPELQAKLGTLTVSHYEWVEALVAGTLLLKQEFTKAKDPTECSLGKWYYSYTPPEHLKDVYKEIEEPHAKFHATAEKIIAATNQGNMDLALKIFENETRPNLEKTRDALTKFRMKITEQLNTNVEKTYYTLISFRNSIFLIFSITIITSFVAVYFFIVSPLSKNFKKLIQIADEVSKGDFSSVKGVNH